MSQTGSQSFTTHTRTVLLDENLTDRREIKRRIRQWQADHLRA